jgi:uncharacterized cupin superfamily protein
MGELDLIVAERCSSLAIVTTTASENLLMNPGLNCTPIGEARLEPAPIPADWVLEGAPTARVAELSRSADGTAMTAVWDCTGGAFNWFFGGDETVHILEGEVTVDDGAARRTLRPGDVAFFPAGTWARWDVDGYVKKLAFCREAVPRPALLAIRLWRGLKRRLRFGGAPARTGLLGVTAS